MATSAVSDLAKGPHPTDTKQQTPRRRGIRRRKFENAEYNIAAAEQVDTKIPVFLSLSHASQCTGSQWFNTQSSSVCISAGAIYVIPEAYKEKTPNSFKFLQINSFK
jgi:hypothetical protein